MGGISCNWCFDTTKGMVVNEKLITDEKLVEEMKYLYYTPSQMLVVFKIIIKTVPYPPYHAKYIRLIFNNLPLLQKYFNILEELLTNLMGGLTEMIYDSAYDTFRQRIKEIKRSGMDYNNYRALARKNDFLDKFYLEINKTKRIFDEMRNDAVKMYQQILKNIERFEQGRNLNSNVIRNENENVDPNEEDKNSVQSEVPYFAFQKLQNYIGEVTNGKKNGKGMEKVGNEIYYGEFKNGLRDGLGILKSTADGGFEFCGEFKEGKVDGKVWKIQNNQKSMCMMKQNNPEGKCIIFKDNDNISIQELRNGVLIRRCLYLKSQDRIYIYERDEKNPNNVNQICYLEGIFDAYVGHFKNDLYDGKGYLYYCNAAYEGIFNQNNYQCVYGLIADKDFRLLEGNTLGPFLNGPGIMYNLQFDNQGDVCSGNFAFNELDGYGEFYHGFGQINKGYFSNGVPKGHFITKLACGTVIEGDYDSEGYMVGPGYATLAHIRHSGTWVKETGTYSLYDSDGQKIITIEKSEMNATNVIVIDQQIKKVRAQS